MKKNIPKKVLREFGFLIGFTFPFLIGWILPLIWGHSFRTWTLFISIPSIILAFTKPILLLYPYRAWMKLGHILGGINSRIILGLIFILVLQPIAFLIRLSGYDPLRKNIRKKKYSKIQGFSCIDCIFFVFPCIFLAKNVLKQRLHCEIRFFRQRGQKQTEKIETD